MQAEFPARAENSHIICPLILQINIIAILLTRVSYVAGNYYFLLPAVLIFVQAMMILLTICTFTNHLSKQCNKPEGLEKE